LEEPLRRIDGHAHYAWPITGESLERVLRLTGADAVCLAALPGTSRLDPTPDILCYKSAHPTTTFAFGCLDCTAYERRPERCGRRSVRRARRLIACGCDGVKLLEGKPTMRRAFPIPDFDLPAWEPFWAYAEKARLPILWHVNDPETFWDPDAIPPFARDAGWGYTDADVNNEDQYRQVRAVLERHKNLNVTFAHLFFLSADLPRLSEWMERFPNMRVDLTPGIELYENLSKTPEETRAFFERFSDRILYGTDIGGRTVLAETVTALNENESIRRAEICGAFLESKATLGIRADGAFLIGTEPFALHGMDFDADLLNKILSENFLAFVGADRPRRVNLRAALRACRRLRHTLINRARRTGRPCDTRAVDSDRQYFVHALDEL